ncbi:hypothetical protein HSX11_05820 [Oxalobacteraceae bacterium]|nr:hypothetical protein [Oxalobacteraceae bacterium]
MQRHRFTLLFVCAGVFAAPASGEGADSFGDLAAVADAALEDYRGGFDIGGGLIVTLGIERLVSINGNIVASSNFSIADVAKMSSSEAQMANEAVSALTLVQNGAGNVYLPGATPPALGTLLIQNSENDQLIRSQTTISTAVNSLSMLKSLNFGDSLRDALNNAVGPK